MSALKPTTVKYKDDFVLDFNSQDINACRAVTTENGVLRGLPVLTSVTPFNNFTGILGVTSKYLYAYTTNSFVIFSHPNNFFPVFINPDVNRNVGCSCRYREQFYFSYEDNTSYKVFPMTYQMISNSKFVAMCFVNDRFLGLTNGRELYLGENGEDTVNLNDAENPVPYVTLPSYCQAMVAVGLNDAYLLGTTCYKLTVSADFSDFKLKRIATGLTEVNKHTVQIFGDKIVFATNNALYSLCNDKVTRIMPEFDYVVNRDYSQCRGSALNGKYVLSARYGLKQRFTYVLDLDKRQCVSVLQEGILDVGEHDNYVWCVTTGGNIRLYNKVYPDDAEYVRSNVDFGTPSRKFLRRLNVRTKGDIRIYLTDEYGEQVVYVKGGDRVQSIPVVASGVNFSYKITRADKALQVDAFELVAQTYKEADYGN